MHNQHAVGEAASVPGKPPHTHSRRPWLLLPGVRCNKGDELPPVWPAHTVWSPSGFRLPEFLLLSERCQAE